MIRPTEQARRRWSMAFRIVAGTLGAYGLTSLATIALSLLLFWIGMDRAEAVIAATLASFALFAGIAMATFQARSAVRAWGWICVFAAPAAVTILMLLPESKG